MTLVYPPDLHKTTSNSIFFIGNAKKFFKVNSQDVELVFAGNFCPVFSLKAGANIFELNIDGERFTRTIFKENSSQNTDEYVFQSFPGSKVSGSFSRVCVDPGHGGVQYGTQSPKAIKEKDLNLDLSKLLKNNLESFGFEVLLTRDHDRTLSLQERVEIAADFASDLFISIHHNAIPDHLNPIDHHGLSVHYYYEHSKALAVNLSESLSSAMKLKNNSAIKQNLYVLRENFFSQAVLLEAGFLIHPQESELITSEKFQEQIAFNLAELIFHYK